MSLVVREWVCLKPFNTFGFNVRARFYAEAHTDDDVHEAIKFADKQGVPLYILGGGSNLVLTEDIRALVLHMRSQGVRLLQESAEGDAVVEAEAGESWHGLVEASLDMGLSGLENLSLIPGTVGASPMQNIGAYGVELKDVFNSLTALDRTTGQCHEFTLEECCFGYRESRFKQESGRWIILRVRFNLSRHGVLRLDYGPIRKRLAEQGINEPSPRAVSQAVISIRQEKLPDPAVLGNAGSFFKNPVVSNELAAKLRERYSDLVVYPVTSEQVKLAAGWLIDKAGWKGFREGDAGVHAQQALVLVNHGAASGKDIVNLAQKIRADIESRFCILLEMEPGTLS
ncbi:UDP-N-acetylmuramate dehydrogenase [Pseudomonas asuensis]|uniref:UDP-N-acetylenolpyruvoylglucosamine reductase n=1 Tax=Pseudomonas asuensis TaxID=1825787 RepID=A0ABQ2H339_9PSED|nr:UDP-N-acetylmuramate dehydrogenase [Pseudomonas asuensis]GGM24402.1 UDP-N-acetylenolpyruvoylglucosamine reductase [Pseudomonas asuensis]